MTKDGAGHTFYWIGKPEGQPRLAGVGFAVRTSLPDHLASLPIGINEQLMTMRIHLANSRHMTVMSVYAPAVTHSDDAKEEFYEILSRTVSSIPPGDKIMILGDFNARVGQSTIAWGGHPWSTRYRCRKLQWDATSQFLCSLWVGHYEHAFPTENIAQDNLDALLLQPLASPRLRHCAAAGPEGCPPDPGYPSYNHLV